jgi:hypothetical protein
MTNILDLITKNNITLHLISKGDKFCKANGEETYINSSYSAINEIWLGIYDDAEIKNLSLFHEVAHCLIEKNTDFDNVYELERTVWNNTFDIAEKCDVTFSKEAIKWADKQLKTYKNK